MKNKFTILLISASMVISGCGGGESSGESNTQPVHQEKQDRTALSASDLYLTYSVRGIAYPKVSNVYGNHQSYRLADGALDDVVMVDPATGTLTILSVGETQVTVEDSSNYYKTSATTFNVTVEQAENKQLFTSYLKLPTIESEKLYLSVQGNKGDLSYSFEPEGLVTFDETTSHIVSNGNAGRVDVTVTDSGDRNYRPSSYTSRIDIHAVDPERLTYEYLERHFTEGLTLSPAKATGIEGGSYHYELAEGYEDSQVLTVSPDTGYMMVKNSGDVKVKVTQQLGSEYDYAKQETYFDVHILKGAREPLHISDAQIPYQADYIYKPAVNNNKAPVRFEILTGEHVVQIDQQTGQLKIVGVGYAEIKVIDDKNANYPAAETLLKMTVSEAAHPGLKDQTLAYTYSENMTVSPSISGQIGSLSFAGTSDIVEPVGNQLRIKSAGTVKLSVTDDGGEYYQSVTAVLTVTIHKAAHPSFAADDITTTYYDGNCAKLNVSDNKGQLLVTPISSSDDNVAEYNAEKQCFLTKRSGTANFDIASAESQNYLASEPKRLKVVVNPADSHLTVSNGLPLTFAEGKPTFKHPAIGGGTGHLSFELVAEQSDADVIEVDPVSGQVTVLNAGSALVKVTDSGDDKHDPASVTFPVTIEPANNPVYVSYSNTDIVYEDGGIIRPEIINARGPLSYKVYDEKTSPVELNSAAGDVVMRSTGTFYVTVNAEATRNYKAIIFNSGAFIDKAPHPGIEMAHETIEYAPLKKATLELPKPYGTRSYWTEMLGGWEDKYVSIDHNSGELSLYDYDADARVYVHIAENESQLYKALDGRTATRTVTVTPPQPGKSTQDISLAAVFSATESSLNYKPEFGGLEYSLMNFAGAKVLTPTEDELQRLGKGVALEVMMKPVEESLSGWTQPVRIYAQRYEGCADSVNILNLPNLMADKKAVSIDKGSHCLFGKTNRLVTYTVVDKNKLDTPYTGKWETQQPFVAYRQAVKYFVPNEGGGLEVNSPDDKPIGWDEAVKLLEWNRVELKLTKDSE